MNDQRKTQRLVEVHTRAPVYTMGEKTKLGTVMSIGIHKDRGDVHVLLKKEDSFHEHIGDKATRIEGAESLVMIPAHAVNALIFDVQPEPMITPATFVPKGGLK
jgi:hypothetical protein